MGISMEWLFVDRDAKEATEECGCIDTDFGTMVEVYLLENSGYY